MTKWKFSVSGQGPSMRKGNRKNKETHKSKEGRGRTGPLREGHLNNDQCT
jgi:hypothetical protein